MSTHVIVMTGTSSSLDLGEIGVLLRGEREPINQWIRTASVPRTALYVAVIIAGSGIYGAAMGCWREPLQGLYTAIKFPLIVLLTTLGNGLLNGMLAPLLGLNIGFRQSLQAVLMSFTVAAAILGSFSPLIYFLVWNAPPLAAHVSGVYPIIRLTNVAVIAFAGTVGSARLGQLLGRLSDSPGVGRRVLFAWLTVNFLLGSQLSWILRPFFGAPDLPVEFLRANAFQGNFFENLLQAIQQLF
jgi:hypothetical protein